MKEYNRIVFDEERALYKARNIKLTNCTFDGPSDGESALKESSGVVAENSDFRLRYPFWHASDAVIEQCRMTGGCRAAIWYANDVSILSSRLEGIKALRECDNVSVKDSRIDSEEFGWMCRNLSITDTYISSEYPFFRSANIEMENLELEGKYSFQYVRNAEIRNSHLITKDAFWHSRDTTVYDSVIEGEYAGWYSENLKLVGCRIIGTQPFCHATGLVLEDCEMVGCDLAFEKSHVHADITGSVRSIKNPSSGRITADEIEEIILDEGFRQTGCLIKIRKEGKQNLNTLSFCASV